MAEIAPYSGGPEHHLPNQGSKPKRSVHSYRGLRIATLLVVCLGLFASTFMSALFVALVNACDENSPCYGPNASEPATGPELAASFLLPPTILALVGGTFGALLIPWRRKTAVAAAVAASVLGSIALVLLLIWS